MNLENIINQQREFFYSGVSKTYKFRMSQLKKLKDLIKAYEQDLLLALNKDLAKSNFESYITEISLIYKEIDFALDNLKEWMKKIKVATPLIAQPSTSFYIYEPLGVNLIISPWNYPVCLTFIPIVNALASGNTMLVKTSSKSKETTKVINKISSYFDDSLLYHIDNHRQSYEEILAANYDHIFFTGSPNVGKRVMQAASKNLSKVTLELGGKSPVLVDRTARIRKAAKKIAWAKTVNAGQTCIAPDYLLIDREVKNDFIFYFKRYVEEFFTNNPLESKDYPKIISEERHRKLLGLLDGEKVIFGGRYNKEKIEPTLVDDVDFENRIMEEEIFGPILPIIAYENVDEVLMNVKRRPKPLAFYLFTEDESLVNKVVYGMEFGGATINDCLMHITNPNLEFGGVGQSGMGGYHGYFGFVNFSNRKSIVKASSLIDNKLKYPPHSKEKLDLVKRVL